MSNLQRPTSPGNLLASANNLIDSNPNARPRVVAYLSQLFGDVETEEAAARYWWRQLLGDEAPQPRSSPDEEARIRYLLERVHPDDPVAVETAIRIRRQERAEQAEAFCWGPDWQFLKECLAARCNISAAQFGDMTWGQVAAALQAACEGRQAEQASETGETESPLKRPPVWGEILESIGNDTWSGQKIASRTGYSYSHVRETLPKMVEAGVLEKVRRGYRRKRA